MLKILLPACCQIAQHEFSLGRLELVFEVRAKIQSYSDIAREAGCTRAAVSAMAKQLPEGIHGRSGRLKSSPLRP
jgi:transcriptional regulator